MGTLGRSVPLIHDLHHDPPPVNFSSQAKIWERLACHQQLFLSRIRFYCPFKLLCKQVLPSPFLHSIQAQHPLGYLEGEERRGVPSRFQISRRTVHPRCCDASCTVSHPKISTSISTPTSQIIHITPTEIIVIKGFRPFLG